MKRIVFLIIATLLVLGLVLPGCTESTPANLIKIAVCEPHGDIQGDNQMNGAEMARDEINAMNGGKGVEIDGTYYKVQLVDVNTDEASATAGDDGAIGSANLLDVIDDVAFCVGGFRTEAVGVYREVAMTGEKVFMDCGAATGALQLSVADDYDTYQYWFKATPYNESFLVKSCFKMLAGIGGYLQAILAGTETNYPNLLDPVYELSSSPGGKLRVHILMEEAEWCEAMVTYSQLYLPALGFNVTGTTLVSPTAPSISSQLSAIAALHPHIIFTAFSGSVGAVYSSERVDLGIPAITIGINVPGQLKLHWTETDGACDGEIMLDTWAENVSVTDTSVAWFNDYVDEYDDYPLYTAGTYDAIKAVCLAMHEQDSMASDDIIEWLENPEKAQTGVGGTTAYYPMPADTVYVGAGTVEHPDIYALNETQVLALYPDLGDPWIRFGLAPPYYVPVYDGYHQSDWWSGIMPVDFGPYGILDVQFPHHAHDTVYGPGYQTGIGSQWQDGHKVGVWPIDFGVTAPPFKLVDQYGDWNFEYDGTADVDLDITGFYAP